MRTETSIQENGETARCMVRMIEAASCRSEGIDYGFTSYTYLPTGNGIYTCADGDKYEGDWANDKRHGKGIMLYLSDEGNTKEKYEGEW